MAGNKKNDELSTLFGAIAAIDSEEECAAFMADVCTANEMRSMARRLDVAIMLIQRKTYIEINELTGASTATISRVGRSLRDGGSGYEKILPRLGYDVSAISEL